MSANVGPGPNPKKQKKLHFTGQGLPSLAPSLSAVYQNPGQKKRWIHQHFTTLSGQSNRAQCKFCPKVLSTLNPTRQKEHLLNVKACQFLKSRAAADSDEAEVQEAREKLHSVATGQQQLVGRQAIGVKAGNSVDCLTKSELMALQQKFADWLYICGIAIWIVGNEARLHLSCIAFPLWCSVF